MGRGGRMKRLAAVLCALMLLLPAARAEVRMFAVSVGKGDAIIIQAGDYTCMIDTGKKKKQENIEAAFKQLGVTALDAIFITHTDDDHVGGLKWLRDSDMEIRAIYASAYFPETTLKKHQAVKTADELDLEVQWLTAGMHVPLGGSGAVFHVLAPEFEIPGNEDDNSLVMMLDSPDGRILLAGDMELAQESVLLNAGYDLRCNVLKVANHADGDATSKQLINACGAQIAVISTSTEEKEDTPDPGVLRNLQNAGYDVYITQDCSGGILVTLDGGVVRAQYMNW